MKLPLRLLAAGLSLSLLACGDDGPLSVTRTFDGEPIEQVIPQLPPPGLPFPITFPLTAPIPAQTVETNTRERLKEYGMKEGNLKIAKLKTITISVEDPSGRFTLADIADVVVFVNSANQPSVEIATYAGADAPLTTDQMTVRDVDLRDYVLDEPLEVTGSLKLLKATENAVTARIEFEYEVTGGI